MKEIYHRASIRKFLEKEIEEEKIKEILRAAMASPSAMNERPWEFYVVRNKEKLIQLSKSTLFSMCVKNAPAAIVVCYRIKRKAKEFNDIDCAIATENILLEIDSQGLGGVMIGISPKEKSMEKVEKILELPSNLRAFTIIPFGYPAKEKNQPDRMEEDRIHYVD